MDYGRLQRFVARHGNVSVFDAQGGDHPLRDSQALVERAERFLWDGLVRSAAEMEALVAQSERGLNPGCAECEQLERELVAARERDRREQNMEMRHEGPTLRRFQDHRHTHE
jgi:hypothetical protein